MLQKRSIIYKLPDTDIQVCIVYKQVKNISIRVKDSNTVLCSSPLNCPQSAVTDFIKSKSLWIKNTVNKLGTANKTPVFLPQDGEAFKAGFDLAHITKNEGSHTAYSKQWQKEALQNYTETAEKLMSFFEDKKLPAFVIKGRSMKTLWGSCNRRTNVITINWELFKANQACIDYVIFHEMTHFLYIHHDSSFYSYIQKYMSDYKKRIHHLNHNSGGRL